MSPWFAAYAAGISWPLFIVSFLVMIYCAGYAIHLSDKNDNWPFMSDQWIFNHEKYKKTMIAMFVAMSLAVGSWAIPNTDYQTKTVYVDRPTPTKFMEQFDSCYRRVNLGDTVKERQVCSEVAAKIVAAEKASQ